MTRYIGSDLVHLNPPRTRWGSYAMGALIAGGFLYLTIHVVIWARGLVEAILREAGQ